MKPAAILVAPFVRVGLMALHLNRAESMWFPSVQDSLAMGCLLAVFRERAAQIGAKLDRFIVPVVVITLAMPLFRYPHGVQPFLVLSLMNVGIAICIENFTRRPPRILNWRPVVWLGTLSYSLYLVQMPFFTPGITNFWTRFPVCIVAPLLLAILLHYGIEKPFLQLRARRSMKGNRRSEMAHGGLDIGITGQRLNSSQVDTAS
jgi:peptidoglycan/LPS O-acetylase OafA/YrhL